MKNTLNWFGIPVADMARAARFYGALFDTRLDSRATSPGYTMAMFPSEGGVSGALMHGEGFC